jgi:hypothetical protein
MICYRTSPPEWGFCPAVCEKNYLRTVYSHTSPPEWGFCPAVYEKITSGRSISRILSSNRCLGDHLSGRHVATPLDAAYPGLAPSRWRVHIWRRAASRRPQTTSSLLGLAPSGGYLATHITARAGGPLHHLFTITCPSPCTLPQIGGGPGEGGCLFLWPFPVGSRLSAVSPPRVLSDAVLYGVRTFLDPDNAGPRSPDRPEVLSS